jgi:hypothetical protein
MGSGNAGWEPTEWVPLCFNCHEALDGRLGVSKTARAHRATVNERLKWHAPLWWSTFKREG